MEDHYEFADLDGKDELLKEINRLETKIEQAVGGKVNLIAYSPIKESEEEPL